MADDNTSDDGSPHRSNSRSNTAPCSETGASLGSNDSMRDATLTGEFVDTGNVIRAAVYVDPLSEIENLDANPLCAPSAPEAEQSSITPLVPFESAGIVNQGATCYLNSMLQLLFHINYFRRAVYKTDSRDEDEEVLSIPAALQRVFYQMQVKRTSPVSTTALTRDAFMWHDREVYEQHDIQEMMTLLRESLEESMKGTSAEGAINKLFAVKGATETVTRDGSYRSEMKETLYDIHLPVTGFSCLYDSLKSLTAKDDLTGTNKYKVEIDGKEPEYKDADRGFCFHSFPPVIIFHLKRFEMDLQSPTLEMRKVNSAFSFPSTLDVSEFEAAPDADGDTPPSAPLSPLAAARNRASTAEDRAVYDLATIIVHKGTVRCGHYIAYQRSFDADERQWRGWVEYDDEIVSHVSETRAVDDNYGGMRHYGNTAFPNPQSAYILAYLRRSHIEALKQPVPIDLISSDVKKELDLILEAEERKRLEEERRRDTVELYYVYDSVVSRSVRNYVFDVVETLWGDIPKLQCSRSVTLASILSQIAGVRNLDPRDLRLWTWQAHYANNEAMRPGRSLFTMSMLEENDIVDTMTIEDALIRAEVRLPHANRWPWALLIYVECPSIAIPPLNLRVGIEINKCSVAEYDAIDQQWTPCDGINEHSIAAADNARPKIRIGLPGRVSLTRLSFLSAVDRHTTGGEDEFEIRLLKREDDDSLRQQYAGRVCSTYHTRERVTTVEMAVPPICDDHKTAGWVAHHTATQYEGILEGRLVDVDVIEVHRIRSQDVYYAGDSRFTEDRRPRLVISSLSYIPATPTSDMPTVGPPVLPPLTEYSVFLMLKFFNPQTATISYAGSGIFDTSCLLAEQFPQMRAILKLSADAPLMCFDEQRSSSSCVVKLNPWRTIAEQELINGNIVTVQLHPTVIPATCQYRVATDYYQAVEQKRVIRLLHRRTRKTVATVVMMADWDYDSVQDHAARELGVDPEYLRLYPLKATDTPSAFPISRQRGKMLSHCLETQPGPPYLLFFELVDIPVSKLDDLVNLRVGYVPGSQKSFEGQRQELLFRSREKVRVIAERVMQGVDLAFNEPKIFLHTFHFRLTNYWICYPDFFPAKQKLPRRIPHNKQLSMQLFELKDFPPLPPEEATGDPTKDFHIGNDRWIVVVEHGHLHNLTMTQPTALPTLVWIFASDTVGSVLDRILAQLEIAPSLVRDETALLLYAPRWPGIRLTKLDDPFPMHDIVSFRPGDENAQDLVRLVLNSSRVSQRPKISTEPQLVIDKRVRERRDREASKSNSPSSSSTNSPEHRRQGPAR